MYEVGKYCARRANVGMGAISPTTGATLIKPALPWTATFAPDAYTNEAALIDREWSRVMALPLQSTADKVARYNTVATSARSLMARVGDSRHPASIAMTTLLQSINVSLAAIKATQVVIPTTTAVVKPATNGATKPLAPGCPSTPGGGVITLRAGESWKCAVATIDGKQIYRWIRVNSAGVSTYDPLSAVLAKPTVAQPPTTVKVGASVTPVTTVPGPVVSPVPPGTTAYPVVTDSGVTMQPTGAGFDFGMLLRPPWLYVVIGGAALMLFKK